MAIYKTYAKLAGKTLDEGDEVILKGYTYQVRPSFLSNRNTGINYQIFDQLKLDKTEVAESCYGYTPIGGNWPECKKYDYEALTRLVLFLFKTIEGKTCISNEICYYFSSSFARKYSNELIEYFKTTDIKNSNTFTDTLSDSYYWYETNKRIFYDNISTVSTDRYILKNVESELYEKIFSIINLKSTTNENRFQNKKPQIRRGTVPGGSIIRGRKSKTLVEFGHLSYRTVSCE